MTLPKLETEWIKRIKQGRDPFTDAPKKDPDTYYCTICGRVPVDAENGYDTCPDCAARI